jgi:hypothetical protein
LVQAAECGVTLLEPRERRERVGSSLHEPLTYRQQIENIPIFGHLADKRLGGAQAFGVLSALQKFAYPANLEFYRRRGGVCRSRLHISSEKARHNRVAGELALTALPHHRTCGSASGGST